MNGIGFQRHLKHSKRITAWILTFVMAVGVLAAVPAKQAEAEETEVNLTYTTGEQTVEGKVTEYSGDQKQADISINKGSYSTLNDLRSAGAVTLSVKVKVSSVTPVSGTTPKIQPYVNAAGSWTGKQTDLMADGLTHEYTHDISALTGSGQLYGFGIQFSNIESITYEIVSAKLILSDSGSSGSGSGDAEIDNTRTESSGVTVNVAVTEAKTGWTSLSFTPVNSTNNSICDWIIKLKMPSGTVSTFQAWSCLYVAEGDYVYLYPMRDKSNAVIAANTTLQSYVPGGGVAATIAAGDITVESVTYNIGTSSTIDYSEIGSSNDDGGSGGTDNPGTGSSITGSGTVAADTTSSLYPDDEYNYAKLLQYALYFYDANMCGDVEGISEVTWRKNCHSQDKSITYEGNGKTYDMSGGFHDAGDHDKFALTEGYSASMLGMGYYEFEEAYEETGQKAHYKRILDYFCDNFIKRTILDDDGNAIAFCYQIGDGTDHSYWLAADKENIPRPAYFADKSNPATDQICEPVAAMAIHYVNFGEKKYLECAKKLFELAKNSNKASVGNVGHNERAGETFYGAYGYADDYCLAAIWLYKATGDEDYITEYKKYCGNMDQTCLQAWAQVGAFAAGYYNYFYSNDTANAPLAANATRQINTNTITSDGGFLWLNEWGSARYNCNVQLGGLISDKEADKNQYGAWATGQMRYLLGNNGHHQCYVTWYNDTNASKKPHHRSACDYVDDENGWKLFGFDTDENHKLLGALVGGPSNISGDYTDTVKEATFNEVAIDYNAAFTGAAAALYLLNKNDGEQMLDTNYEIDDGATCDANAGGDPTKPADETNPVVKTVLKDSDITFPTASPITYGQTLADSELSKSSDTYGTYAWKTSTAKPDAGNAEYDVVYTPTNTKEYDYSGLTGYDITTKKVVRKVSVTVNKKEITSVIFPTVTDSVKSGTALSAVTLSKTSDDYGTFAWADKTIVVGNDTTGANVVYTLKDSANYKIASKVTGVNAAGTAVTREVTFTVKKVYANTDVPPAPILKSKTDTSVTLDTYTDDGADTIEYGVKTGSGSYTWQKSNIFTGLSPWTIYTFAMRFADTVNYVEEGKAGDGLEVVTYLSDDGKYTVALAELLTAKAEKYVEAHNGTIEYDAATKTLTLLEAKDYILSGDGTGITVIAGNAKSITLSTANVKKIKGEKDLTVTLSGYNIVAENIELSETNGEDINVNGTLTIESAENSKFDTLNINNKGIALFAENINIEGGVVTIVSTSDKKEETGAVFAETLTVNGGDLSVTTNDQTAIETVDAVYAVNGKITAKSADSYAIDAGNLAVTGGEVEASGSGKAAVYADSITVEDGKLSAVGADDSDTCGILSLDVKVSGGTVNTFGSGNSAGINADKVVIAGGTVNASGAGTAAAILSPTTDNAATGLVELTGGVITVNNESSTVKPVKSDKIVYEGAVVKSDSDPWYSTDPVDKSGHSVTFRTVTYIIGDEKTESKVTVNSKITLNKEDKTGYKFDGWYKDNDKTKVIAAGEMFTVTDDVKFTAVYTKITGKIDITSPTDVSVLREGYTDEGIIITVKNNTNVTVDKITVALSGTDIKNYAVDKNEITSLEAGASATVKVTLSSGLKANGQGYTAAVGFANTDGISQSKDSVTVTRKVYLADADCFKIDISRLNDPGYIEIHNGTVSYNDDVLTLESEGDYTITGKDEELVVKVKDGINGDDVRVSLVDATVKDIQGTDNVTKDDSSKVISKESGDDPDPDDPTKPDPDDPDPDDPVITGKISVDKESYSDTILEGYTDAAVKFTVKNDSNIKLGSIRISLSEGDDSAQYSLSTTELYNMEAGGSGEVTLTLKKGLSAKAAGYKTNVLINVKELGQQISIPVVRKVYLSETESYIIDVSKLSDPDYIEIHNGTISYEKTTDANGQTTEVLNLENDAVYSIVGSNPAIVVKAKKNNATVNLYDAAVGEIQGTNNYFLNGNCTVAALTSQKGEADDKEPEIKAESIEVKAKVKGVNDLPVSGTMKLAVKKTMQLMVAFSPENAVAQELTYTSSNPKVATINASGKITAKKAGKTTITVKSAAGLTKVFKLQVMKKPVKKIKIKASKKTVKVKKTLKLKTSITPNKKQATTGVYWKSSNPKIATVTSKGVVKGVKKGKVKITAIATDGSGKKATVKIQVK